MITSSGGVLQQNEAEILVQSLDTSTLDHFGNKQWWTRHEIVEKLNMQAIYNVNANHDEFVKDLLISHNKIHPLVTELITSELWTEKVDELHHFFVWNQSTLKTKNFGPFK